MRGRRFQGVRDHHGHVRDVIALEEVLANREHFPMSEKLPQRLVVERFEPLVEAQCQDASQQASCPARKNRRARVLRPRPGVRLAARLGRLRSGLR